jgi:hypothetical protein
MPSNVPGTCRRPTPRHSGTSDERYEFRPMFDVFDANEIETAKEQVYGRQCIPEVCPATRSYSNIVRSIVRSNERDGERARDRGDTNILYTTTQQAREPTSEPG